MQQPTSASARAEELVRKFPDAPKKTLARKLYAEFPAHYANLESARKTILRITGCNGTSEKRFAKHPRPKGKAGWKPECPPSAAEPWVPVQIDGPAKVLCLSDIHVPYHSREAVQAAVTYGKKLKPDIVLLNGDTIDFHRISRFQQDPRKRSTKQELEATVQLLEWLRHTFKNARIIYKLGNHDERWDHFVWNKCLELFDLECLQLHNVLKFEEYGIERVGDSPILCGRLPVLHGHELGRNLYAPVNPARTAFLRANHTVLIGHLHRPSSNPESDLFGKETMTWSQGCLCGKQPEYARVNKWRWGFCHIEVAANNEFNMHNMVVGNNYSVRPA